MPKNLSVRRQPSIRKNFFYKSSLTLSSYIMAFITFPYVSRVLGVEKIGLIDFVDNTIAYFLLFSSMGVNLLGVREIASVKDSYTERNNVFSKIFGINLFFTVAVLLLYFIIVLTIPKLNQYSDLFFIGAAKILFTLFLTEWFFAGIENFKYITLRSLTIKSIYIISVFLLIKTPQDYKLYFVLTVTCVILNAIVNFCYVNKLIKWNFSNFIDSHYFKKYVVLGAYNIMTSMYLTFNVIFLGFMTDNVQVGYYTTAHKIYTVILGLFTAFTGVMMPRMSSLLSQGNVQQFNDLIKKSLKMVCNFTVPLVCCSVILTPQIIFVLSGPGYEGAIIPMRIILPAAIFVGIAQVLAIQILAPMKKDKILFMASCIGAGISLLINILLVASLKSVGSALVLLCSEISVTTLYVIYVTKYRIITLPFKDLGKSILVSIPSIVICLILSNLIQNSLIVLLSAIPLSIIIWMGTCKCFSYKVIR